MGSSLGTWVVLFPLPIPTALPCSYFLPPSPSPRIGGVVHSWRQRRTALTEEIKIWLLLLLLVVPNCTTTLLMTYLFVSLPSHPSRLPLHLFYIDPPNTISRPLALSHRISLIINIIIIIILTTIVPSPLGACLCPYKVCRSRFDLCTHTPTPRAVRLVYSSVCTPHTHHDRIPHSSAPRSPTYAFSVHSLVTTTPYRSGFFYIFFSKPSFLSVRCLSRIARTRRVRLPCAHFFFFPPFSFLL